MKQSKILSHLRIAAAVLATAFSIQTLQASPYASALNYYASSNAVTFILNEGSVTYPVSGSTTTKITNAVTVLVTYEDGTTNDVYNGLTAASTNVTSGLHFFYMTNSAAPAVNHTGYSIAVTKIGSGVPNQISIDSSSYTGTSPNSSTNFTYFNVPRGMAVNSNPKIGSLFGRVYVANATNAPIKGLYMLNADFSLAFPNAASMTVLQASNSAAGGSLFINSGTSGPWKLRVAPDNQLIVGDFSTPGAALWLFSADLTTSNLLLGPVGQTAPAAAGIHGDMFGTAKLTGSLAQSNLTLWVADGGMPVPSLAQNPNIVLGPGTSRGMFNNLFRFDIGAGPLPWTNGPNYAFNYGLDVIGELTVESDIEPNGKVITAFGRSNLSNPILHVLGINGTNDPGTILWDSWADTGGNSDPWAGGGSLYPYAGVRVSPDNNYLISSGMQNSLLLAKLTNGIPDDNTLIVITNSSAANTGRGGVDWDAANNVYQVNGNTVELRSWSLGNTLTCVTSNDITGTNGTFIVIAPPVTATAVTTTLNASQGYGTPTPGVITISLSTNILTVPTTVAFTRSGTAFYATNYTLNLGANVDGVIITPTNVTFPTGTYPHVGNWSVNVQITPTAIPLSGPTTTATFTLLGGAAYTAGGSTAKATVNIINTGPQLLTLSVLASGSTFSRAVTNDYVKFVITRFGDTTVPAYTVTNINYQGTANYPADYTARAQRFVGSLLNDGSPGFMINPGEVLITNAIGNPLMRANLNVPAQNVTLILSLTNAATGTNVTSSEGYAYVVATNVVTLTELDNAYGNKVLLWSNSLNNAADSTNWTLTYASQNLGTNTVLPVVVPNYTNGATSMYSGGTNDFDVQFGYPLPAGIPPSPAMIANGWTNVLRMTVNKSQGTPAGVNLYPQGQKFVGNYGLRFSMYLSIWPDAVGNIFAGVLPREYATFGLNHTGTNCNWRPSRTAPAGTSGTTNADGIWFAIDAADNAATPADFDAFTSPGLPNAGVTADYVSNAGSAMRGIFKNPPFGNTQNPAGGEPVDQWADVSVEITRQTNCTIYINGAPVLSSFSIFTNTTSSINAFYTTGTVMLGYLDPDASIGDPDSQFVFYSNVRAVELSPYITAQPPSLIVTPGSSIAFTSSATYATSPITNTWYLADTNRTPVFALQTDTANTTNLFSTFALSNVQHGTNYVAVFSDPAGSVTGLVASVTVVVGPTSQTVNSGTNFVQFVVSADGPVTPTYQWKTNGVNLVNGSHFTGVTSNTLTIANAQLADGATYFIVMTNAGGGNLTLSASLTVIAPAPTISTVSLVGTNAVLGLTTPNGQDNTGSFTLQSSVNVQGPYTNTPSTVTGTNGVFSLKAPLTTNSTMFYRVIHN